MKKKVLLVFTGGTIGGTIENNAIVVDDNMNYILLDMYNQLQDKEDVEFDIIKPVNILSENATAEDWNKIAKEIQEKDLSKYKGIVIAYGTDTLGYFANVLSYLLYKVEIPIAIASSNFVLTDEKTNGLENFKIAINFVAQSNIRGVFVAYKNYNGKKYIHQGTRIKQIGQLSGSIYSIRDEYFAEIIDGKIVRKSNIKDNNIVNENYNFKVSDDVLYIKSVPGMKYNFNIDCYKVIFHETFHTGAIPQQAIDFIKKCKEKNLLIFVGVLFDEYKTLYFSTAEAEKIGVSIIFNMSQEALFAKLMVATGTFNTNEEIKEFMSKNIIGEILE